MTTAAEISSLMTSGRSPIIQSCGLSLPTASLCATRAMIVATGAATLAENSGIEWCDHTWNPWWGCARVSPACAHCYADALARRYGHHLWDDGAPRRFFGEQHWAQPRKWNRQAERAERPAKVFCASMADVFEDHPELDTWRARLWPLIEETPMLEWQLLTKRPENVAAMTPWADRWPANVWIGTSIENSRHTFRADVLRRLPAAVRFISAEPLLGSLFLNRKENRRPLELDGIDWVIAGGESGPRFRGAEHRVGPRAPGRMPFNWDAVLL